MRPRRNCAWASLHLPHRADTRDGRGFPIVAVNVEVGGNAVASGNPSSVNFGRPQGSSSSRALSPTTGGAIGRGPPPCSGLRSLGTLTAAGRDPAQVTRCCGVVGVAFRHNFGVTVFWDLVLVQCPPPRGLSMSVPTIGTPRLVPEVCSDTRIHAPNSPIRSAYRINPLGGRDGGRSDTFSEFRHRAG